MFERKIIFGIIMVLWMTIIFIFSSRTGVESTEDSYDIGLTVGKLVVPAFENLTVDEQMQFAEKVDYPVRKTAHAAEYAVLGVLAAGTFYDVRRKKWLRFAVPWVIGTAYAASDEIHQLFVPGRSGQFTDVLLDSAGVLAGVVISLVIAGKAAKKRQG